MILNCGRSREIDEVHLRETVFRWCWHADTTGNFAGEQLIGVTWIIDQLGQRNEEAAIPNWAAMSAPTSSNPHNSGKTNHDEKFKKLGYIANWNVRNCSLTRNTRLCTETGYGVAKCPCWHCYCAGPLFNWKATVTDGALYTWPHQVDASETTKCPLLRKLLLMQSSSSSSSLLLSDKRLLCHVRGKNKDW